MGTPKAPTVRFGFWLRAALILAVGCWVFAPVLHGPWLWDDDLYITHNPLLRSLAGLREIWLAPTGVNYFPVTFTVQWLEWHAWGDNPVGYHCVNIALHLAGAFLLWRLLWKLKISRAPDPGRRPQAGVEWVAALIFAIHPLAVESVAWISELKNTLSTPLLLLAMIAWIDRDETSAILVGRVADPAAASVRRPTAWCALFFFLAAMLAKSTVAMFPFVLLLYAWWRRGRIERRDLRRTAPCFAISLGLGLLTVWFERHRAMGGISNVAQDGLLSRIAGAGLAVGFYFAKCVAPFRLSLIYPPWTAAPIWLAGFLCWLLIAAVVVWLWRKRARGALFGLGCFGLNLVPILGIVPMAYAHVSWVADHFAYLSLAAFAGICATAIEMILGRGAHQMDAAQASSSSGLGTGRPSVRGRRGSLPRGKRRPAASTSDPSYAGWFVIVAVLAVLVFSAHRYASVFADGETLWREVIRRSPGSAIAHNDLGLVLSKEARWNEAIAEYDEAVRLDPDQPDIRGNFALALRQAGRVPPSIAEAREAIRLRPDYPEAENTLGEGLLQSGRSAEALPILERAIQDKPDYAEARNSLGLALLLAGRLPEAIDQDREALRLDPSAAEAHFNLGLALAATGRPQDAAAEFEEALRLKPDFAAAEMQLKRLQR